MSVGRITLLIIYLLFPLHVYADSSTSLNLYTEEFPPYNYKNGDQIVGINHDIVMSACELSNIKCKTTLLPWLRAVRDAKSDSHAGIYSIARRKDREDNWQWIGPLLSSQVCLYKSKNRTDIVIETKEDLSKYTLGVSTSFAYPDKLVELGFKERINKFTYLSLQSKMLSVDRNKVDLMLGSVNTMALQLKLLNRKVEEFTPVWHIKLPDDTGNYLALNKEVPAAVVDSLNNSFNTLRAQGSFQKIKQKYINTQASTEMEAPINLQACIDFPSIEL